MYSEYVLTSEKIGRCTPMYSYVLQCTPDFNPLPSEQAHVQSSQKNVGFVPGVVGLTMPYCSFHDMQGIRSLAACRWSNEFYETI
jgi:hypothetical protein